MDWFVAAIILSCAVGGLACLLMLRDGWKHEDAKLRRREWYDNLTEEEKKQTSRYSALDL